MSTTRAQEGSLQCPQTAMASEERDLAERLMAVLVEIAHLVEGAHRANPASCGPSRGGTSDVEEFARHLYAQIAQLNATWLSERRSDPRAALANAWAAFVAIGRQRGLVQFLALALQVDAVRLRPLCLLITALLIPPPGVEHA